VSTKTHKPTVTNQRSASQNRLQSPLLCLPSEIRNRIYAFAFTVQRVEIVQRMWVGPTEPSYTVTAEDWRDVDQGIRYPFSQLISSTTVCRQFYAEASPLIPRLNEFCFTSFEFEQESTENMPHKYLQAIETIRLADWLIGTSNGMQLIADNILRGMCGLKKIVVRAGLSNLGSSLHGREVSRKMFVDVLRKRGIGCEVVFEYPVKK
jgi:hypothetical protein